MPYSEKIENLKPYEKNAKKHPKKQIEQVANSIKEFGIYNRVTDNYYKYSNPNQYYLKGLLLRYNKTYEN